MIVYLSASIQHLSILVVLLGLFCLLGSGWIVFRFPPKHRPTQMYRNCRGVLLETIESFNLKPGQTREIQAEEHYVLVGRVASSYYVVWRIRDVGMDYDEDAQVETTCHFFRRFTMDRNKSNLVEVRRDASPRTDTRTVMLCGCSL